MTAPLRISVTDVDQWQYWLSQDGAPIEALRRRLQRKELPGPAAVAGTAWHRLLETAEPGTAIETAICDGHAFAVRFDATADQSPVRECRIEWAFPAGAIAPVQVTIAGRVDGMDAAEVRDHKTGAQFDPEARFVKWQWRIYLAIADRPRFRWDYWTLRQLGPQVYDVTAHDVLTTYAPPGNSAAVRAILAEFVAFALEHDLYTGPTSEPIEEPEPMESMV